MRLILKELRPFYPAEYYAKLGDREKAAVMVRAEFLALIIAVGLGLFMAKEGMGVGVVAGAGIYLLERWVMAEEVRRGG